MSCDQPLSGLLATFITRFKLKQKPNIQNSPVTGTSGLTKVLLITFVKCSFIHAMLWSIFFYIPVSISSISAIMHFVLFSHLGFPFAYWLLLLKHIQQQLNLCPWEDKQRNFEIYFYYLNFGDLYSTSTGKIIETNERFASLSQKNLKDRSLAILFTWIWAIPFLLKGFRLQQRHRMYLPCEMLMIISDFLTYQ